MVSHSTLLMAVSQSNGQSNGQSNHFEFLVSDFEFEKASTRKNTNSIVIGL